MSSYYDIDAILTDSQKVPCTFELTVPGLGYLDGNAGQDMKQGTKVELPLWLGEMLAVSAPAANTSMATLDLPVALSARVMNALKADPRMVDLRALAPHFYALGARMLELFEEEEMGEILADSFKSRAKVIADQAHNPRGALGEGADFMRGLDENERQLFRAAHDSAKAVRTWIAENKKK
ncbi:DNA replication complex GINS protein PSF3 [Botryosphaeria dothidea]|uniref:DNA replication complex GINS protein PSF3 n=1 Tax=Botryosphaeria dothidea TaxID=55169 RepID=A0A8H4J3M7_9PEZI|nr:DNA replication complex GINS protein PSF3 [Botryosphaeria dothidea]